jgi:hypothetical protein
MNLEIRVRVRGSDMLQREVFAIGLQLVSGAQKVCCGKASAGEGSKWKPASALSYPQYKTGRACGSDMRFFVSSCARTMAPAA